MSTQINDEWLYIPRFIFFLIFLSHSPRLVIQLVCKLCIFSTRIARKLLFWWLCYVVLRFLRLILSISLSPTSHCLHNHKSAHFSLCYRVDRYTCMFHFMDIRETFLLLMFYFHQLVNVDPNMKQQLPNMKSWTTNVWSMAAWRCTCYFIFVFSTSFCGRLLFFSVTALAYLPCAEQHLLSDCIHSVLANLADEGDILMCGYRRLSSDNNCKEGSNSNNNMWSPRMRNAQVLKEEPLNDIHSHI